MVDEAEIDELLQIVGDVRPKIEAPRAQLASGQDGVADIEEEQRLDGVDIGAAVAVELVLDDVEQAAMQPLDELQGLEVQGLQLGLLLRLRCGLMLDLRLHGICPAVAFDDCSCPASS